ncbi:MAG: hypothetical protein JEY99_09120 [Spirochaetales bacterium]|nr:hypothetical protein [Spirochaetales bacterium]
MNYFKLYIEQDNTGKFDLFTSNTQDAVTAQLFILEEKGRCEITSRMDRIESIIFTEYFQNILLSEYQKVERSNEEPFPTEKSSGIDTLGIFQSIDVKNDFLELLAKDDLNSANLYKINFPGDINEILITGKILKDRLLILSLQRIKEYLNSKNNSNYLFRKLCPVLKQTEQSILDSLNKARNSPTQMVQQIESPSEVTFPFWAQVSNFIIKELKEKNDKLARDNTFCQAAYLIGFYNIFYRDRMHKDKERSTALASLGTRLRKPPYAFSLLDIMSFKDGRNRLLDNKYSKEHLIEYLEEKTTPAADELLPEVIRIRTVNRKEYYLHREIIVPLCYKKVNDAHDHYRNIYLDDWQDELKNFKTSKLMQEDDLFLTDLENRIKGEDPLLYSLLNYDLLYLVVMKSPNAPMADDVKSYLNIPHKGLYPLDEILRLKRKDLLVEARRILPFWRSVPVVSHVVIFFMKAFSGGKKTNNAQGEKFDRNTHKKNINKKNIKSGGESNPESVSNDPRKQAIARQERFKKQVFKLKKELVGEGVNVDTRLFELSEKWNPLFDLKAKEDLVEDVNCLARDYLRALKKGLLISPPDIERIRNMAGTLVANKALSKIKKKEELERYLEIYLIKLLQQNVK